MGGLDILNLKIIDDKYKKGHTILMMIDSDMIADKTNYNVKALTTNVHWVVYVGGLNFTEDSKSVGFSIYTWSYNPISQKTEDDKTGDLKYKLILKIKKSLSNHSKVTIMDILKYISLLLLFFIISCRKIEYTTRENSFYGIYLKDWNSPLCPKKIILERYTRDSNFKKLIDINSDFDIEDCNSIHIQSNQRILRPNVPFNGQINYDIRLIVDDSLEYKIIGINGKIDTVTSGGRPGDFIIMNNIKSFVVNGHKLDNTKAPFNIDIPTKSGKVIKK